MSSHVRNTTSELWRKSLDGLSDLFPCDAETRSRWDGTTRWVEEAIRDGRSVSVQALYKQQYRWKHKQQTVVEEMPPSGAHADPSRPRTRSIGSEQLENQMEEEEDHVEVVDGEEDHFDMSALPTLPLISATQEDGMHEDLLQQLGKVSAMTDLLGEGEEDTTRRREERLLRERREVLLKFVVDARINFPKLVYICEALSQVADKDGLVRANTFYKCLMGILGFKREATTNSEDSFGESCAGDMSDEEDSACGDSAVTTSSSSTVSDSDDDEEEEYNGGNEFGNTNNAQDTPEEVEIDFDFWGFDENEDGVNILPPVAEKRVEELIDMVLAIFGKPIHENLKMNGAVIVPRKARSNGDVSRHLELHGRALKRSSLTQSSIDFRQIIMPLCKVVDCDINDRIKMFFRLYGDEDHLLSIAGLCVLLYWGGDRVITSSLRDAEKFMQKIDEDGDGGVTFSEFQSAVEREPFILETIVRKHNEEDDTSIRDAIFLRKFVHRTNLTWETIYSFWLRLQEIGSVKDHNESLEIFVQQSRFERELLNMLRPPQREDSMLVRYISSIFALSKDTDSNNETRNTKQFDNVEILGRKFIIALGSILGELNLGISQAKDKARFYFGLYNIDGDQELSKEEIYEMLYANTGPVGEQIMKATTILKTIDMDGDNMISYEEYIQATEQNPSLLDFFRS